MKWKTTTVLCAHIRTDTCDHFDRILLEKIQHRFTKMIDWYEKFDYEIRLAKLHLWTLEERRNRSDLILVYKMINDLSRPKFEDLFQLKVTITLKLLTQRQQRKTNSIENPNGKLLTKDNAIHKCWTEAVQLQTINGCKYVEGRRRRKKTKKQETHPYTKRK